MIISSILRIQLQTTYFKCIVFAVSHLGVNNMRILISPACYVDVTAAILERYAFFRART